MTMKPCAKGPIMNTEVGGINEAILILGSPGLTAIIARDPVTVSRHLGHLRPAIGG